MPPVAVETENLRKQFEELIAVNNVSFSVQRGEMFGLVGPDGAGKTTTIRMLCGVIRPSSGKATVLGYDLLTQSEQLKTQIGYLSQRFSLYGDLTVDENIEFFAEIHAVQNFKPRRDELLEFTRLTPFRNRLAEHLSGGMKQKLALACTLIHTPQLIFLDEPTTGVDPVSRRDFWRILSNLLKSGITIIMTTPYLDEAERCTGVALMNKSSLLVVDTPQKVKSLMKGEVVELVTDRIRAAFSILRQSGKAMEVQAFGDRLNIVVQDHRKDIPVLQKLLMQKGIRVESWRVIPPSLENVFISLMSQH